MPETNVIKYEFTPWTPPVGIPPEGEFWSVKWDIHTLILSVVDGVWRDAGGVKYKPEGIVPIAPFIDPRNPITLDQVPEGEICWTEHGEAKRNGKQTLRADLHWHLSSHQPEFVSVYARPNAAAALKDEAWKAWRKLADANHGLYVQTDRGICCHLGGTARSIDGYMMKAKPSYVDILLDERDKPIIYGTNPKRID